MADFETKQITYFKCPGRENTEKTLELCVKRVAEGDIKKIVVATSSGETGLKAVKAFSGKGVTVVPVTLNAGSEYSGSEEWEQNKKELEKLGVRYVQGIQAFSGVERAIKERWDTSGPVMILSDALRVSGEGFKVAIEVAIMAADAGAVSPNELILSIAGTSRGADTALVIRPAYSTKFFDLAVREIVCKPLVEGVKHKAV